MWRERAVRAEHRLRPLRNTMERTQQESAAFKEDVCSRYDDLQREFSQVQQQLMQANTVIEELKAESERCAKRRPPVVGRTWCCVLGVVDGSKESSPL